MRRTLIVLVATGALAVTGCGGDDGGDGDAAARGDGNELCEVMEAASTDFPESQEDFLEQLRAVDPPAEIEDDFERFLEGMEALVQSSGSEPEDVADAMADYEEAGRRVDDYVNRECDLTPPSQQGTPDTSAGATATEPVPTSAP